MEGFRMSIMLYLLKEIFIYSYILAAELATGPTKHTSKPDQNLF